MAEHVTFLKMKVLPGKLDELRGMMTSEENNLGASGWVATIVGQSKDEGDILWGAVLWDTSDNYYKNADSPEQNAVYKKMRALLSSDPEWHDCNLIEENRA
jgi:hypothetical protein